LGQIQGVRCFHGMSLRVATLNFGNLPGHKSKATLFLPCGDLSSPDGDNQLLLTGFIITDITSG
jgi:hypothetical protein